jgi:hypothetical protein
MTATIHAKFSFSKSIRNIAGYEYRKSSIWNIWKIWRFAVQGQYQAHDSG